MANKDTYKKTLKLFSKGKLEKFENRLANDVQWHLHGYKTLEGKEEVKEFLYSMPWDQYTFITRNLLFDGNSAVVEGTCQIEDGGEVQEHFYCDVYKFNDDDLVAEMASYFVFTLEEEQTEGEDSWPRYV